MCFVALAMLTRILTRPSVLRYHTNMGCSHVEVVRLDGSGRAGEFCSLAGGTSQIGLGDCVYRHAGYEGSEACLLKVVLGVAPCYCFRLSKG